jgi:DNA polymerase III epsilon subunit-like protein
MALRLQQRAWSEMVHQLATLMRQPLGEPDRESAWLVCVDLKTTGLSPIVDRVVQMAAVCEPISGAADAVVWGMSAVPVSFSSARSSTLAFRSRPRPRVSTTSLLDDDVAGAPTFVEAFDMLRAFLGGEVARERARHGRSGATSVCLYVVAHNGEAFEFPLFEAEMARAVTVAATGTGAHAAGDRRGARRGAVCVLFDDTCLAARALRVPLGLRSCTLVVAHSRLGGARAAARRVPLVAHDALGDATAVSDIMTHPEMFRAVVVGARELWWLL